MYQKVTKISTLFWWKSLIYKYKTLIINHLQKYNLFSDTKSKNTLIFNKLTIQRCTKVVHKKLNSNY